MTTPGRSPRRVLVLEDQPELLELFGEALAGYGCDVVLCQEIEAAETLLAEERFSALVTDLNVSARGGAEGLRLARFCRTQFPDCRVVIASGHITQEVERMARDADVSTILHKPFSWAKLAEAVFGERVVPRRASGDVRRVPILADVLHARCVTALLQPIVHLRPTASRNRVFAVEGLARGPHGTVLARPDLFLGVASRKGRGVAAEFQCIDAVLDATDRLRADVPIFLNVQPRSLSADDFADRLLSRLERHAVPPSRVVLEITEHETIVHPAAFGRALDALRRRGFRFALDDYGEGVSNLLLLQSLEPEFVKLSSRLTARLEDSRWAREMLRSTAGLAEALQIEVIVEGIETPRQAEIAGSFGARFAQGYHFARPGSVDELEHAARVDFLTAHAG
ncbi:MAG: EAL domain-containing protein [Planctomycetota bacterium JB042]